MLYQKVVWWKRKYYISQFPVHSCDVAWEECVVSETGRFVDIKTAVCLHSTATYKLLKCSIIYIYRTSHWQAMEGFKRPFLLNPFSRTFYCFPNLKGHYALTLVVFVFIVCLWAFKALMQRDVVLQVPEEWMKTMKIMHQRMSEVLTMCSIVRCRGNGYQR